MKKFAPHITCSTCPVFGQSSFCELTQPELQDLESGKQVLRFRKNETVFSENGMVRGLHCVFKGTIKLFKTLQDGDTQLLRIAGKSELIGYRGLFGDGRYIASGVALEDTTACFIPRETVLRFTAHNPSFTAKVMTHFAKDLSLAENKAVRFAKHNARSRLAQTLLLMEESFGNTSDSFIGISLSRADLASLAGIAKETTVRLLKEWEAMDLLMLDKRQIRLTDKKRLTELTENLQSEQD